MKVRQFAYPVEERNSDFDLPLMSVSKIRGVIRRDEISDKPGRADSLENYRVCSRGDLVINRMSAYSGALGLAKERGLVSPDYLILRVNSTVSSEFVGHLFKSHWMISEMSSLVKGIGSVESGSARTPRINWSDLAHIQVDIPSRSAQDAIVDFLDRELNQMNALVEKQEQLIELLVQLKLMTIADAVTGASLVGQFTDTPLPWLRRYPKSWTLGRVKQIAKVKLGKMVQPDSKSPEEVLVPYLSSTSVQETGIVVDPEKKMWASPRELTELFIKKNDVLVLEGGAAGRSFRTGEDLKGVIYQNSLNRVRLYETSMMPQFFDYWMNYLLSRGVIEAVCNKATIMHLTAEKLNDLPVLIPPLNTQIEIINHVDSLVRQSDLLISRAQTMLNVLSERKGALINEAIMGKLDLGVIKHG